MVRQFKTRILIVDDEPDVCTVLTRIFEQTEHYLAASETDPFRALQHARQFRPDIVVLDLSMPGQDGFEIARRLRTEPWLRYRPIIFYSAMPKPPTWEKFATEAPAAYLTKGDSFDVVVETADRLMAAMAGSN